MTLLFLPLAVILVCTAVAGGIAVVAHALYRVSEWMAPFPVKVLAVAAGMLLVAWGLSMVFGR